MRSTAKPATQIADAPHRAADCAKGESITLSSDLFADLVPGTGAVSLSVGPSTALDAAALLKALDRYPFGCSEQITSRALPLLYVNELASEAHLALDTAIDQRIRDAIERLLARQGSNGSFGLWSAGGDDAWLDAYVTDFLTRARERNFAVPDVAFRLALDHLRNSVANAERSEQGRRQRARLRALRAGAETASRPLGDLRYLADTKLDDVSQRRSPRRSSPRRSACSATRRAPRRVYAAALAATSRRSRELEFGRTDYGSSLRDAAALRGARLAKATRRARR